MAIQILEESLINKIAAGEVIENSASIVKELIENALDAGATEIEIITKGGGRNLISISDNGSGMRADELPLAFYRHATSKIDKFDDLYALNTFGFRGEALASIAAVSRLTAITCQKGKEGVGHKIEIEGGKIIDTQSHPRKKGTTIEVNDLFFNVPVRRQFQHSLSKEINEIHKVLIHSAMANPDVYFKWVSEGKVEFSLEKGRTLLATMETFLGKESKNCFFAIEEKKENIEVRGFLSLPSHTKTNKTGQYLFVNNRPVLSTSVATAILEGYGTRISERRYPQFILFLTIPPHLIDVNVHPQKKEIRFQEDKKVEAFFIHAVNRAFEKVYTEVSTPIFEEEFPKFSFAPIDLSKQDILPRFSADPALLSKQSFSNDLPLSSTPNQREEILPSMPQFSLIAIIENTLLIEKNGLWLIDVFRAQKRIFFEKIVVRPHENKKEMQSLLFPITLELKGLRKKAYEDNSELFERLHISIRSIGGDFFMIDSLPFGIDEEGVINLLDELEGERGNMEKKVAFSLNHLIKRKRVTQEMGYKLVEELFKCESPYLCPEGKPTLIAWPKEEIKRLFL